MLPTFREDGDVVIIQKLDHSKTFFGRLLFNNKDDDDDISISASDEHDPTTRSKPKPAWRRSVYKRGDAVISYCKDDVGKTVCKRVAALEGDMVSFRGNGTYVGGTSTLLYMHIISCHIIS
jgi:signal peptidase I